jgi:CubicO group peptidase (beta-lactamase class C family)
MKEIIFLISMSLFLLSAQITFSQTNAVKGIDGKSASLEEIIDNYFNSFPAYEPFSGVVLVAKGNDIIVHKGYDLANREFGIKNGHDTRFQIGSITKGFTAMLALKMAEKGLIDLNKTISDYLPYYPEETGRKISLYQLLSCTSGIPHHYQAVPDFWRSYDHYFHSSKELLSLFWNAPLKHEPGKKFTYSSPGYYIIGAILQQMSKKSYAELMQEYIFIPLGMKNTFVENNRTTDVNMATGYLRGIESPVKAYVEDKSTALAAGDIVSTAYDLYLWQKAINFNEDQILSAESKKILLKPVLPEMNATLIQSFDVIPYGEGKNLSLNVISGSSSGYMSCLTRMLEEDVCIIVLSNINDTEVNRICDDIGDFYLRRFLGVEIGPEAPLTRNAPGASHLDKSIVDRVIGFYRQAEGNYFGAIQDGDNYYSLNYIKGSGINRTMELIPFVEDTFYLSHDNRFRCVFSPDKNDGTLTMSSMRNGRTFAKAKRYESKETIDKEYEGSFTSLELQKTTTFIVGSNALMADNLLGKSNVKLTFLEKDLFGFEHGFIEFKRDKDGIISEFAVFTKDTDRGFGSKWIKIAY